MGPRARLPSSCVVASGLALGLSLSACDRSLDRPPSLGHDSAFEEDICGPAPHDVVLMDACALGSPCLSPHLYGQLSRCAGPSELGEPYTDSERCALEFLSSGAPGRLVLRSECEERRREAIVYVIGDGEALLMSRAVEPCAEHCLCDLEATWGQLARCTLQEPEMFRDCLEAETPAEQLACMSIDRWFTGCAKAPPTCIP
ncbi:MAG: hypothetical protein R3A51_02295 [Nannocystaceae bacterium]|nr:hypothetical protein [Myxococcales bacterium]